MDDPFISEIERECFISSSQEERLRNSGFCLSRFCDKTRDDPEFSSNDESTEDGGMLVDSTGIEMHSLSEDKPASQSDEFLTPQENILMSSQEQAMNLMNLTGTGADDHHKELKARGNVSPDHIVTVDLGKDNVPGFSLGKSPADKGLVPGKEFLGFSGDSSSIRQRISGEFFDGTRAPACGAVVEKRSGDSALRKNFGFLKQNFETVNLQSGGVGGDIPVGTESVGTGFKKNATKGVAPLKATEKEPEFSVHRGKEVRSSPEGGSSKKISKRQSTCKNASKVANRRQLPASMRGPMQNAAKRLIPDSSFSENQSLKSLMDAVIELSGGKNATGDPGNVDILETAKQRGMTFPRPRWWPPEGF
ncbi:hypothetical protein NE237_013167 [Protea cynaroides]|uniref:Uncharacterized protein n=1 Tax=Protea cynaroides TaxID=273540 RepID=A0A9Q0GZC9_9MAGN|nr:hypothetical protein NE237_013167 [Protea cynaroides]